MSLIYFILCAYGLTQLIVYSKIFEKLRPDHYFFRCPMCMGFWVGIFLLGINKWTELFTFNYSWANFILLGCLSSSTSYVLCRVFGDEGIRLNIHPQHLEEEGCDCHDNVSPWLHDEHYMRFEEGEGQDE